MKKIFILLSAIILTSSLNIYGIKFKVLTQKGKDFTLQAIFDTGFSAEAIADGVGITDYETVFFKPAFHVQDFGIGLNFDFRFRLFTGEATFRTRDWYEPDEPYLTAALYLDKIDYIKYGDLKSPFYANLGKNPITTFGTGFLVKDFHNYAFLPTSRELGFIFKFNGNYLSKLTYQDIPYKEIPIEATFLTNDVLDPDIFAMDLNLDAIKFTKFKDKASLKLGVSSALDINATEANRLSSLSSSSYVLTNHRNLNLEESDYYTSIPLFFSLYSILGIKNKKIALEIYEETGFLFDIDRPDDAFNFGFGIKAGAELKFINLKKSGYLLGVSTGLVVESSNYSLEYFSSNYEVVRQKQYYKLATNDDYTFYMLAGFGIYAFQERLRFNFDMAIPLIYHFSTKLAMSFVMEDTVVPGLVLGAYYQTGVNAFYANGAGGGFIDSITRDFRFYVEVGYKFFGAKLSILVGVQRPGWVSPTVLESTEKPRNPFTELNNGDIVPSGDNTAYNWDMNLDDYSSQLEKFISLEISFVF